MSNNDLYYLRSILRHLRELRTLVDPHSPQFSVLGSEIMADNIDWLDCFIDRHVAALERTPGKTR
jgi:hypothetical protein